jgi:hypothetical protein
VKKIQTNHKFLVKIQKIVVANALMENVLLANVLLATHLLLRNASAIRGLTIILILIYAKT